MFLIKFRHNNSKPNHHLKNKEDQMVDKLRKKGLNLEEVNKNQVEEFHQSMLSYCKT